MEPCYELAALLLGRYRVDPNTRNADGATALHVLMDTPYAMRDAMIKFAGLLLDKGVDPNARDSRGETALFGAAQVKDVNGGLAALLMDKGTDMNARYTRGETALFRATEHGRIGTIKTLLLYGADPNAMDNEGTAPLDIAHANNDQDAIQVLTTGTADQGP